MAISKIGTPTVWTFLWHSWIPGFLVSNGFMVLPWVARLALAALAIGIGSSIGIGIGIDIGMAWRIVGRMTPICLSPRSPVLSTQGASEGQSRAASNCKTVGFLRYTIQLQFLIFFPAIFFFLFKSTGEHQFPSIVETMADTNEPTQTTESKVEATTSEATPSESQQAATEQPTESASASGDNQQPKPAEEDNAELDPNTGWLPLESNPEVVNPFAHKMGLPKEWGFCDIYGLEDWAFDMVSTCRLIMYCNVAVV